ncbi:MAG: carotenoid oxygenase family protein [Pseudonocardia sp.]
MRTPYYLDGHLAPVPDEIDSRELRVTGALPPELTGRYLRNGPNPRPGEDPGHLFFGHGMIHGIRIAGGQAQWYRNRWVRTGQLEGRRALQADGTVDRSVGSANTHVMSHAGRIYALVESSFPHELTRELDTVGPCDFGGRLTTGMTAHPKEHPGTGDLHFFGYGFLPPYLTYHRLSAKGVLEVSVEIDVPGPTMNHDFAITAEHALFLDQPITFQFERLATGMPFAWDDAYGARIGVMPLDRPGEVRWFDVDPGYVFHVGNAHSDAAGRIVLEAPRHDPADAIVMWDTASDPHGSGRPGDPIPTGRPADVLAAAARQGVTGLSQMHRWTLDPATGAVTEEALDDRGVEFPTLDDSRTGLRNRYLYTRADARDDVAVVKYDLVTGARTEHALGPDVVLGEAEFVPSPHPGRAEDDGWLMAIVNTRDGRTSHLLVLDATDVTAPPTAVVHLPRRVPTGFHGSWIPDTALA